MSETSVRMRSIDAISEVDRLPFSIHAGLFSHFLCFMDAPLLRTHQLPSHTVQIRQREERVHLRKVLRDSPVAHLRMTPQTLDHQEGMLDRGPDARQTAVTRPLCLCQRAVPGATFVDVERDAARLRLCLQFLGVVGRIRVQALLATVQQLSQYVHVRHIGRRAGEGVNQSRIGIHPDVHLHAEVPLLACPFSSGASVDRACSSHSSSKTVHR